MVVTGGRGRLRPPPDPIDLGNSGTGMRLLAGVVATLAGATVLTGDDSLRSRPMDRVAEPLGLMGAEVTGPGPRCLPPITVAGGPLRGIDYTPADGQRPGQVGHPAGRPRRRGRDRGARAGGHPGPHRGDAGRLRGRRSSSNGWAPAGWSGCGAARSAPAPSPCPATRPRPPSGWPARCWCPGSLVTVDDVQLGIERVGFLGVLRRMGATIEVAEAGNGIGSVTSYTCALHGTVVEAEEIPSLDEVPILAVAAAVAHGTTRFRDVGELRVKESDRLAGTAELVRAFGGDGRGRGRRPGHRRPGGPPRAGRVDARGDHRMAMAAAIAGAACPCLRRATTVITGWDAVATSYPGFADDLARLAGPGAADGDAVSPAPAPATRSSPSTARPGQESPRCPGPWPTGWASTGWTPGPCTGRWPGPPSTGGVDPGDRARVAELARSLALTVGDRVEVDGTDVTDAIRGPEVSRAVSVVAANPDVRAVLVERQRQWVAEHGGGVVEGRDIGSVVFPHADLKIYLTATAEERARRRPEEGADAVARRDRLDSTRAVSPLGVADGARVVDTTDREVDDIVEEVVAWL